MYNARSHETVSFFVDIGFKPTGPARTVREDALLTFLS